MNLDLFDCDTRDYLFSVVCFSLGVFNQLYSKSYPTYSSSPWNVTSCLFIAPKNLMATVRWWYLMLLIYGTRMRSNSVFLLVIVSLLLHSLTEFSVIAKKRENNLLETAKKPSSTNAVGLVGRGACVWMDYSMCACHSQLFPLNCELYFKCEVISRKKMRHVFVALRELFNVVWYFVNNMTKHFTSSLRCTTASSLYLKKWLCCFPIYSCSYKRVRLDILTTFYCQ